VFEEICLYFTIINDVVHFAILIVGCHVKVIRNSDVQYGIVSVIGACLIILSNMFILFVAFHC